MKPVPSRTKTTWRKNRTLAEPLCEMARCNDKATAKLRVVGVASVAYVCSEHREGFEAAAEAAGKTHELQIQEISHNG